MSRKGEGITEEKAKRIAVGATVAGVLLIVFLVVILIIQGVIIGTKNSRKEHLDDLTDEYRSAVEQGEKDLNYYRSGEGLYYYARQYGFK